MTNIENIILAVRQLVKNSVPQGDGYETVNTPDLEYLEFLCWKQDNSFPISDSAKTAYADQM